MVLEHQARGRHANVDMRIARRSRLLAVAGPIAEQSELLEQFLDRGVRGGGQASRYGGKQRKHDNRRNPHAALDSVKNTESDNSSVLRVGNRRRQKSRAVLFLSL